MRLEPVSWNESMGKNSTENRWTKPFPIKDIIGSEICGGEWFTPEEEDERYSVLVPFLMSKYGIKTSEARKLVEQDDQADKTYWENVLNQIVK